MRIKKKSSILGLITGVLLLNFPIFFFESFVLNWITTYSYQFFVIIGISISIYFVSKLISFKIIYILIFLIVSELGIYGSFILAAKKIELPSLLLENIRYLYNTRMVNVIQFNPFLSEYDEKLFYKLKQGNHRFFNLEFSTKFSVNSIGARDDEQSINLPKIICIGDSFTMGWGVENENIFSSIIEEKSKAKTLNLGVSSYGTAREFLFLNKINLDSCEHIIIQFCENDVLENRAFVENNFTLEVSNEEIYAQAQRLNHLKKSYYPFKWIFEFSAKTIRSLTGQTQRKFNAKSNIDLNDPIYMEDFFRIVDQIPNKFSGRILVFIPESNSMSKEKRIFPKMSNYLEKYPRQNILIFDSSTVLTDDDFYNIDGHLNNHGHQKIAHELHQIIAK